MSQKKKCLITGINGQLGQQLSSYLSTNHADVEIIGTVRHKSKDTFVNNLNLEIETMDLSDPYSVELVIKKHKPDYVINTAANAFVGESWKLPVQHFSINALGVLYLLEAIKNNSPSTKFYNCGTSEEFGDVDYSPQDEKHPLKPRSPYGAAKCAARHLVKVYRESFNLFAIQGWMFNFESPFRGEKYVTRKVTKGVARIAKAIKKCEPFEPIQIGNLNAKRPWQHANDVCRAIWLMLNNENPKEYVVSSSHVYSVRQFIESAFTIAGFENLKWEGSELNEKLICGNLVVVEINKDFFRPAEVELLLGDSSLIKKELGWEPEIPFETIVKEMVEYDISELQ